MGISDQHHESTDFTRRDFIRMTGLACLSINDTQSHHALQRTLQDNAVKSVDPSPAVGNDGERATVQRRSCFYDEIVTKTGRISDTDYYITTVPKFDSDGDLIKLHVASHPHENPLEHAASAHTTLTVNGNCTILMKDGSYRTGISIGDGSVLSDNTFAERTDDIKCPIVYEKYIGITKDRQIREYDMRLGFESGLTANNLIDDGCENVINCYFKLIENGKMLDIDNYDPPIQWNSGDPVKSDRRMGPMMIMGVKKNDELVFLATDGRSPINLGLTYSDATALLVKQDCIDAYVLDGGGSVAMILRGSKINRNVDGNGARVRNIHYSIDFMIEPDKASNNSAILGDAYAQVGLEKQRTVAQIAPYLDYLDSQLMTKKGQAIPKGADLNDYSQCGKYYSASTSVSETLSNCPIANRGFTLFVIQTGQHEENSTQLLLTNTPLDFYHRVVYPPNNVYRPWTYIPGRPQNCAFVISPGETIETVQFKTEAQASVTWSSDNGLAGYEHLIEENGAIGKVSIAGQNNIDSSILSYEIENQTLFITNHLLDDAVRVIVATTT